MTSDLYFTKHGLINHWYWLCDQYNNSLATEKGGGTLVAPPLL